MIKHRRILRTFGACLTSAALLAPAAATAQPTLEPEVQTSETEAQDMPEEAPAPAEDEEPPLVWGTPAEQRIREVLSAPEGVQILFTQIPLKDAMDFLADEHGIMILADGNALTEAGVSPETPINASLSGITLRSALHIMLRPMGLTAIVEDEVLKVTTLERAEERTATRVYNLSAIGGDALIDRVVRESVAPDTWRQGGGEGTAVVTGRSLVVTQTHAVHERVEALLRRMQQAHAAQAKLDAEAAAAEAAARAAAAEQSAGQPPTDESPAVERPAGERPAGERPAGERRAQ